MTNLNAKHKAAIEKAAYGECANLLGDDYGDPFKHRHLPPDARPEPTDPSVIRAAEGVVLEPGEYEAVEIAARDEDPGLTVGQCFTLRYRLEPEQVGDSIWGTHHTLLTAVRRVQEQAPQAEAATGELYVPKVGERVRVVEIAPDEHDPRHSVGETVNVESAHERELNDGWLLLFAPTDQVGTWCRVEPVKWRTTVGAALFREICHALNSRTREGETVTDTFERLLGERDEALAKVAEVEIDRDSARAVIAVLRQELLVCEGESATAAIRQLRTSLAAAEHQAHLLRADLGELGIDQPGSCDTPEGAAAQARVDARMTAVERERDTWKSDAVYFKRARDESDRQIDELTPLLSTRTAELEAARQLLRYSCSLLKPRFQPNYTRDEDHVRAVERFLAESPEPPPGVEAPEVGK